MALTKSTYTPGPSQTYQDVAITPATLADGTLGQRFQTLAFPQKGVKYAGTHGDDANPHAVPTPARTMTGAGS